MSSAALFVEAIDTAITLAHALIGWLIFLAVIAAILILAAIATGAWGVDAVRRRVSGRHTAELPPRAPEEPRDAHNAPQSRVPSWANTQPLDCEEAA